jgi:alpha-ketoglutarate-dependent taurine dioxygenase
MRFKMSPIHGFGALVEGSGALSAEMLHELRELHALVLFRGFAPPTRDELVALASLNGRAPLLEWSFGPVMEMREDATSPNYLFSNEAVPFHWDGAFHRVPSHLVFHCVQAPPPGAGGETLFANTERIVKDAFPTQRKMWESIDLTYRTDKLAHYGGVVCGALVQKHPRTGAAILRYAEPVKTERNPVELIVDGLPPHKAEPEFLAAMQELIYDPRYCYSHAWREGDVLVADNHTLIHGRRAFTAQVPRWLRRVQIL